MVDWTETRIAKLKLLHREGLSGAAIAKKLGPAFTKGIDRQAPSLRAGQQGGQEQDRLDKEGPTPRWRPVLEGRPCAQVRPVAFERSRGNHLSRTQRSPADAGGRCRGV
jgi:hypothetical protein